MFNHADLLCFFLDVFRGVAFDWILPAGAQKRISKRSDLRSQLILRAAYMIYMFCSCRTATFKQKHQSTSIDPRASCRDPMGSRYLFHVDFHFLPKIIESSQSWKRNFSQVGQDKLPLDLTYRIEILPKFLEFLKQLVN